MPYFTSKLPSRYGVFELISLVPVRGSGLFRTWQLGSDLVLFTFESPNSRHPTTLSAGDFLVEKSLR